MIELALNGVKKYFGATQVLNDITFDVQTGEKVGIVGRNGTGKTTILKIICGIESKDEGMVTIRKGGVVGYLDQIPDYPEVYKVSDVLYTAFEKLHKISESMKRLEKSMVVLSGQELENVVTKYGELQNLFETEGGYKIEENISKVCIGLKINDKLKNQLFNTLSGGEKTTVILAKILLQNADILLLDEPSNHLDMESIEWLEDYLREYKGASIIVSHDRYFLDRVTTKIVEVEDMDTTTYIGNYSSYVKEKETNMLLQFESYKEQQKKIQAMEKTVKDLRDWGNRGDNNKFFTRAASIEKKLEKLTRIEKPNFQRDNIKLNFSMASRSGNEVIKIENASKAFGNKVLLKNANLLVRFNEKTALIGKNGCGKSTLIKMLLKDYEADSGVVQLGESVKIGYLPQNITFNNDEYTVLDTFRENIVILEGKAREYLAKFMFYGESVFKKVKSLSGGEKSRLKLSMLMFQDINLLILDEPTNHLDIDSIETLEYALLGFDGTIFFISHDRYFINSLCTRLVEINDNKLISYDGNYDYYKEKKNSEKSYEVQRKNTIIEKNIKVKNIKNENKSQYTLKRLEDKIEELENEIKKIDLQMQENPDDYQLLRELYEKKLESQKELDPIVERWVDIC